MNPTLVEPGVKYFLNETLKQCGHRKNIFYNHVFNITMFVAFALALTVFLYIKYHSHNNHEEKLRKKQQEEDYMLNLIHKIQTEKRINDGSKITDLPEFESEFEMTMKKFI